MSGCELRHIEYDGSQYCGVHFGFTQAGGPPWCDLSPRVTNRITGQHVPHCTTFCSPEHGHALNMEGDHRHQSGLIEECESCVSAGTKL